MVKDGGFCSGDDPIKAPQSAVSIVRNIGFLSRSSTGDYPDVPQSGHQKRGGAETI